MREIKFRAWHHWGYMVPWKVLNDHFSGKLIAVSKPNKIGELMDTITYPYDFNFFENTINKDFILMQFTGLLDKNGKEIYEGDIVKVIGYYFMDILKVQDVEDKICQVWHDDELAYFNIGDIRWNVIPRKDLAKKYFEVIGNIYENKDLL